MQFFKTIGQHFAGEYPTFSIKERAARIVSGLTAINFFIGAGVAIVLGLDINYIFSQIIFSFPFIIIFYMLVNKKETQKVILLLVIFLSIIYALIWFFSGGINGPGIGGAIFIFYCNLQIAPSKYRLLVSGNILLVVVVTLSLNYLHPNWVTEYPNTEGRYTD